MTMSYVSVALEVQTAEDTAAYSTRFSDGLNVIQARNSWGKSTLVQSLVYGLGLEGSFSTSHLSPLGEAMTSSIELNGRRQAVVESTVTLVVRNSNGRYLRTKRWAQSLSHKRHLVQTWEAGSEAELSSATQIDTYVRESGSAIRELGFHTVLTSFIGWELPRVPSFNGNDTLLYLEVLFPMFYVEQKYGWSGLSPRIPTNFQIQAAYRRAAEYVLGLDSLERTRRIEQARQSLFSVNQTVKLVDARLLSTIERLGWRLVRPIPALSSDAALVEPDNLRSLFHAETDNGEWVQVGERIRELSERLIELQSTEVEKAGPRTANAQRELRAAEQAVVRHGARIKRYQELMDATVAEYDALSGRLADLNADRDRLLDIAKLERLGSDLDLTSLQAHCPTCAQSLDAAHVATGIVLDLASNTKLVASERSTVESLIVTAERRVGALGGRIALEQRSLRDSRQAARSLRDELVGPTNAPSIAQVRARVALENQIVGLEAALDEALQLATELSTLLAEASVIESNLRILRREDPNSEDLQIVRLFGSEFRDALEKFGFSSLPVHELTISASTLLPEHEGFELTFDINHGLSASDTIRAKWAFYVALARVCAQTPRANPLGTLIMDEPRQQEAALGSVSALYRELANIGEDQQVIVASSADKVDLAKSLDGLPVNQIGSEEEHVLSPI